MKAPFAKHLCCHNHSFIVELGFAVLNVCKIGKLLNILLKFFEINEESHNQALTCLNDEITHKATSFLNFLAFYSIPNSSPLV